MARHTERTDKARRSRRIAGFLACSILTSAAQAQTVWTGGISDDPTVAGNWLPGVVPGAGTAVNINTLTNAPVFGADKSGSWASTTIGGTSAGRLTVRDGGTLSISSQLAVGGGQTQSQSDPAGNGTLLVTGMGSLVAATNQLFVGIRSNSVGTVTVDDGAILRAQSLNAGTAPGSVASIIVSNGGLLDMSSSGSISMGNTNGQIGSFDARLTIINGGRVLGGSGGQNTLGAGTTLLISGAGSELSAPTVLNINGAARITDGGELRYQTLTVNGDARVLIDGGAMRALVANSSAGFSMTANSRVDATNGTIQVGSILGLFGSSVLTLNNTNVQAGSVRLAQNATLVIGAADGSAPAAAGTFVGDINQDSFAGNATVVVNHSGQFDYAGGLGGNTVFHRAGVTTLTSMANAGPNQFNMTGGTLVINGNYRPTAFALSGGATLAGRGQMESIVTVQDGIIAPGDVGGVGTLRLGRLILNPSSVLNFQLGAPGGTAGVTSDLIRLGTPNVTGSLTLDGTLNVADAGGFGPGLYRLIDYNGSLTNNGLLIGATPAGYTASSLTVQTSVASQVNLLVGTPAGATSFWDGAETVSNNRVDGGSGIWSATGTNWTIAAGARNGVYDPAQQLTFAAAPGTVTIDNGAGAVFLGLGAHFFTDGYRVTGGALRLDASATTLRVGDGMAAGANIFATIDSALTGTGGLNKTDLGTLRLTGPSAIAGQIGVAAGNLTIDGTSGGALSGGRLFVASVANERASVMLSGGAVLTSNGASIGNATNTVGALTLSGAGTRWNVVGAGVVRLGDNSIPSSQGTVDILDGAVMNYNAAFSFSPITVAQGSSIRVSGSGSRFEAAAIVSFGAGAVGGALLLENAGAALFENAAFGSTSLLSITGGARLETTSTASLSFNTGSRVLVSGAGSEIVSRGPFSFGANGPVPGGDIVVSDNAIVRSLANTDSGLGFDGARRLIVSNGARFEHAAGTAAGLFLENATVLVTDATFRLGGTLLAGQRFGNSTVILKNADFSAREIELRAATDRMVIGGDVGEAATGVGPFVVGRIALGAATTELILNHNGTGFTIGAEFRGLGRVRHLAGDTRLTGATTQWGGSTQLTGGSLAIDGLFGNSLDAITVGGGAALSGRGTIGGSVTVSDGTIRPGGDALATTAPLLGGNAIGTLTIGRGLTLGAESRLAFQLGAPGAPLASDRISVGGNLVLDGTLDVSNAGGFGAGLYRLIDYAGTLTNNGLLVGTAPAGFAASDLTVQTSVASQVNLLVGVPAGNLSFWDGAQTVSNNSVDGGSGVWTATGPNWTTDSGARNGNYDPTKLLTFTAAPGAVTIDSSGGAVFLGLGAQFAVDGYRIRGDALRLDAAATTFRVGDGTAAGASIVATIDSALTGTGGINKTDLGTLVLTGASAIAGDIGVTAGSLLLNGVTGTSLSGGRLNIAATANASSSVSLLRGAVLSSTSASIGDTANAMGALTLSGAGTQWNVNGAGGVRIGNDLVVGAQGFLEILGGAVANFDAALSVLTPITVAEGSSIRVAGGGSRFEISPLSLFRFSTVAGSLMLESGGIAKVDRINLAETASLSVTGGARLESTGNRTFFVSPGARVLASGSGSEIVTGGDFAFSTGPSAGEDIVITDNAIVRSLGTIDSSLGFSGGAARQLIISNGARFEHAAGVNAGFLMRNSTVLVTDATFALGGTFRAEQLVGASKVVLRNADFSAPIVSLRGASDRLVIGGDIGEAPAGAGRFFVDRLDIGSLGTELVLNHNSTGFTVTADFSGLGTVRHLAGDTRLTSSTTQWFGTTQLTGGSLAIDGVFGDNQAATTAMAVSGGAVLSGRGTIGGSVTVADAIIRPGGDALAATGPLLGGNAVGTLAIGRNLTLGAGSRLAFQLGVPGSPSASDRINVGGNLVLDGTLDVSNAGSFGAGLYRLIDYAGALTDNGLLVGAVPAEVAASDLTVQTSVPQQVNLLVGAAAGSLSFWDGPQTVSNNSIDGGSGTWRAPVTNWTTASGGRNGVYDPASLLTFAAAPGTVTIDNSGGAVFLGLGAQFAVDGYRIAGGALRLDAAATTLRVGDGTPAGAAIVATIDSALTGTGGINKTDLGTLRLTRVSSFDGNIGVPAGNLTLDGASGGSLSGGRLNVAAITSARSSVTVTGGAVLTSNGASIGDTTNAVGAVTLTGAGTRWNVTGAGVVRVGNNSVLDSQGSIDILDGAEMNYNATFSFAPITVARGSRIRVSGAGSRLDAAAIAAFGPGNIGGDLLLENGGIARLENAEFGGTASLTITGGARLETTSTASLSFNTGARVLVAGFSSEIVAAGGFSFNANGPVPGGDIVITDNAVVRSSTSSALGFDGARRMIVSNGGRFDLGTGGGSGLQLENATVLVTDATFTMGGTLLAGQRFGNNTIILRNAEFSAADVTLRAATDRLVIGGDIGEVAAGAGRFAVDRIDIGAAATELVLNHDSAGFTIAAEFRGLGAVRHLAGDTRLTGRTTQWGGRTQLTGGSLAIEGLFGNSVATVTVSGGAVLSGRGTIGGSVSVADGSIHPGGDAPGEDLFLAGGDRIGTLTIGGTLTLEAGSRLDFQLGAPGAPVGSDRINVGGNLVLDGTLDVSNGGGFGAGLYRLFDYAGAIIDNGLLVGAVPEGFTAADLTVQTSVARQVNLLVGMGAGSFDFWDGATTVANGVVDGGTGVWSALRSNWTLADGSRNGAYDPDKLLIFSGIGGTVTIDGQEGPLFLAEGAQFAVDGYRVIGDGLLLNGALNTIRVGDGTAAGAAITTAIAAPIFADGGLDKTDLGSLILTGNTSLNGPLQVREGGVTVTDGTTIFSRGLSIGSFGSQAALRVTGAGSGYRLSGALQSGAAPSGAGVVEILDGATLRDDQASGETAISFGRGSSVLVSGVGSLLRLDRASTSEGSIVIDAGAQAIVVPMAFSNGGSLAVRGGSQAFSFFNGPTTDRWSFRSNSSLLIQGADTLFQAEHPLIVVGGGSLIVEDNARLIVPMSRGTSALGFDGLTTMNVRSGALFELAGDFLLENSRLTVEDARVDVLGAVDAGERFGNNAILLRNATFSAFSVDLRTATDRLVIGGEVGEAPGGSGMFNVGAFNMGNAATTMVLNHINDAFEIQTRFTGQGVVRHLAGATRLGGRSESWAGVFDVSGGSLAVDGLLGGAASRIAISGGATLSGRGQIGGSVTVADGLLAAGGRLTVDPATATPVGILTIDGSLALTAASVLAYDLGDPSAEPGAASDLIHVGGNLTLAGTLNVGDAGGFGAGLYRLIGYGGSLVDNGLAIGATPAGFAASDLAVVTATPGQVNLLVGGAPASFGFWDGADIVGNNVIDGGTGTWSATATNWTQADGARNGVYDPASVLVFAGDPGRVTVDNAAGAVSIGTSVQFAVGGYRVAGGALLLDAAATTIRVGDGTVDGSDMLATIDSALTGMGSVVKADLGTLVLNGSNSFNGLQIDGGTVRIGGNLAAGTGAIDLSGAGRLQSGGAAVTLTNGLITTREGRIDVRPGEVLVLDGIVSGNGFIQKSGGGTLVLNGANSFTGGVSFNGTVRIGSDRAVGSGLINFVSGTLQSGAAAVTLGNDMVTFSAGGVDVRDGEVLRMNGAVSGSGSIDKVGAGTLVLTGANSYAGGTSVTAGRLVGDTNSLRGDIFIAATSTAQFDQLFDQPMDGSFSGALAGSGRLGVTTNAVLSITGASGAFAGTTLVERGRLNVTGDLGGQVEVRDGSTLAGNGRIGGVVTVQRGGFVAPGEISMDDSGTVIRTVGTLSLGSLVLSEGSLLNYDIGAPDVAQGVGSDFISIGSAAGSGDLTLDGTLNIVDAGGFGEGLYRLIGYTGALTDNGLAIGSRPAGFAATDLAVVTATIGQVNLLVGAPATNFTFWDGAATVGNNVIDGGSGTWSATGRNWTLGDGSRNGVYDPTQTLVFAGAPGTVTVDNAGGAIALGSGAQFFGGGYTVTGGAIRLDAATTTIRVGDGTAAGAAMLATVESALIGPGGLGKTDLGTLKLTGANSYTGGTSVTGGTLVGNTESLRGDLFVGADSTARFDQFFALPTDGSFAGTLSGSGTIGVATNAVVSITGSSAAFAGTTIVEQGRLNVTGDLGGRVDVRAGGTLAGNGRMGGAVTVERGGFVAPGEIGTDAAGNVFRTVGTLSLGSLILSEGSFLNYNLGAPDAAPGMGSDFISIGLAGASGDLTLDGTLNVANVGGFGAGLYRLIGYTGALTDNGLSLGSRPTGFATSDLTVVTATPGQVNLLVGMPSGSFGFWDGSNTVGNNVIDGGSGTWSASGANWTQRDGARNDAYDPASLLVFAGTPGTITVDNGAGDVSIGSVAQFASDGYRVAGGAIRLDAPDTIISVDDGTPAGLRMRATIDSALTGPGRLVKDGVGTLDLNGDNSFSGLRIDFGTVRIGSNTAAGIGNIELSGVLSTSAADITLQNSVFVAERASVFVDGGASLTLNGIVSGDRTLGKSGFGTLILENRNTFAGLNIIEGRVQVGSDTAAGLGQIRIQSGAALLSGHAEVTMSNRISVDRNAILLVRSEEILTLNGVINDANVQFNPRSTFDVLSLGPGTLVLNNVNNARELEIRGGTIRIANNAAAGTGLIILNTTLQSGAPAVTLANGVRTGFNSRIDVRTDEILTLEGDFEGNGAVRKSGDGILVLKGNNSIGSLRVEDGTLRVGSNAAAGSGAIILSIGATLQSGAAAVSLGNAVTLLGPPISALFDVRAEEVLTLDGNVEGEGSLRTVGAGVLVLNGDNSFDGLSMDRGTVRLGSDTAGGSGTIVFGENAIATLQSGAPLVIVDNAISSNSVARFEVFDGDELRLNGRIFSSGGAINKLGLGTLALNGNNSVGILSVDSGTVRIGSDRAVGSGLIDLNTGAILQSGAQNITLDNVVITNGVGTVDVRAGEAIILAGVVSGGGSIMKTGDGLLALSGTNRFGGLFIRDGVVRLDNAAASGSFIDLGSRAVLQSINAEMTLRNRVVMSSDGIVQVGRDGVLTLLGDVSGSGTLIKSGAGLLELSGRNNFNGLSIDFGGVRIRNSNSAGSGRIDLADNALLQSGTRTLLLSNMVQITGLGNFDVANGESMTLTGEVSGSGSLSKVGDGTLVLTGANSYSGITSVIGGRLVGNAASIRGTVNIGATSVVEFNQATDGSLTGGLSGSGTFIKTNTGVLTSGFSSSGFSGTALVSAGTLNLFGEFGGTVQVADGATLAGNGRIRGAVTVQAGIVAPGDIGAVGSLSVGSLALTARSVLNYQLGAPGPTAGVFGDFITIGSAGSPGNLTLDGTLNIADAGGFGTGLYRLMSYTGTLTDNGLAIGTTPTGFAAGDLTVVTATANQVNLLVGTPSNSLIFWDGAATTSNGRVDGGTGNWSVRGTNWTQGNGARNGIYDDSAPLIFAGTAGTVTVDNSAGRVVLGNGAQFAVDGYRLTGRDLGLGADTTTIRVGDGTSGGVSFVATIENDLTGRGSVIKTDLGTLVLNGKNGFNGLSVEAGTVRFGSSNAAGGGLIQLSAGTTLQSGGAAVTLDNDILGSGASSVDVRSGTVFTLTGNINSNGSINKTGFGTLVLNGFNTFQNLSIDDGTVRLGNSLAAGLGRIEIKQDARLESGNSDIALVNRVVMSGNGLVIVRTDEVLTFDGIVDGDGAIFKQGQGTLVLSGSNGFGNLDINDGTVRVASNSAAGTGSVFLGSRGGLQSGARFVTLANSIVAGGGFVDVGTLDTMTLNGLIDGDGGIRKIGGGVLVLNGDSSIRRLNIFDGTVRVGGNRSAGIGRIDVNFGATLQSGRANLTLINDIFSNSRGNIDVRADELMTLAGDVAGTFSKSGAGTLVLNGDNSFSQFDIDGGTVRIDNVRALGDGLVKLNGDVTLQSRRSFTTLGNNILTVGSPRIDVAGANIMLLNGEIGGNGSITKTGTGRLELSGNNSFTNLIVNGGTIRLGGSKAAGDGFLSLTGNVTLEPTIISLELNNPVFTSGDNRINVEAQENLNLTGPIAGTGSITKRGDGRLELHGDNSFGALIIDRGSVLVGSDAAAGIGEITIKGNASLIVGRTPVTLANPFFLSGFDNLIGRVGGGLANLILNGDVSGSALNKIGDGDLVLNGLNSFTDLLVDGGTVQIGRDEAAGLGTILLGPRTGLRSGRSAVRLDNQIVLSGDNDIGANEAEVFTLNGAVAGKGLLRKRGFGTLVLGGENSYENLIIQQGTLRVASNSAAGIGSIELIANGVLQSGRAAVTLANPMVTRSSGRIDVREREVLTLNGVVCGDGSITKTGLGALVLNGANIVSGDLIVSGGVVVGAADNLGFRSIRNDAALIINQTTNAIFSRPLSGIGTLTKAGAGTLTMTAVSPFSGPTTVAAGRYVVQGSLRSSPVLVKSGAVLAGNGRTGRVTVERGGIIAPGNSIGTLSVDGGLSLEAGSVYEAEVSATGSDLIIVDGEAAIAGDLRLIPTETFTTFNTSLTLISAKSRAGSFANIIGLDSFGAAFVPKLVDDGTTLSLRLAPASLSTMGGAALTNNGQEVASAFDRATAAGYNPQPFWALYNQGPNLSAAFTQLAGEVHSAGRRVLLQDTRVVREAAFDRLNAGLADVTGQTVTSTEVETAVTAWMRLAGSWGVASADGIGTRFTTDQTGFLTGFDYAANGYTAGGMFHHTRNNVELASLGNSRVESTGGAIYGGWRQADGLAIGAGGSIAGNSATSNRAITAPGLGQSLRARVNGTTYQVFGELAYDLAKAENARVEPFARLAHAKVESGVLRETGGVAALVADQQSVDLTQLTLGVRGAFAIKKATITGSAGWLRSGGDRAATTAVGITGVGTTSEVQTVALDREALALDVQARLSLGGRATLGVGYSGVIGKQNSDHGARATLTLGF
jgi:autotransporter-associated beta strand protein